MNKKERAGLAIFMGIILFGVAVGICSKIKYGIAFIIGVLGAVIFIGGVLSCSPSVAQQPTTSLPPFTSVIEEVAKPKEPPKVEPVAAPSLAGLIEQVRRIEAVQKAQLALTLVDTYGSACGRRLDAGEEYDACVNAALSCALASMSKGQIEPAALKHCGEGE